MAMTVLVVGAVSSYAQCLFGLDGEGGLRAIACCRCAAGSCCWPRTRHSCWRCSRWRCRWRRWRRWAGAGGAGGGHAPSVEHPREQTRWRFSMRRRAGQRRRADGRAGDDGSSIFSMSVLFLLPAAAAWAGSLWWYGRELERAM